MTLLTFIFIHLLQALSTAISRTITATERTTVSQSMYTSGRVA